MGKNRIITVEQQRQQGVRPAEPPAKYVAPEPRRDMVILPPNYNHTTTLDIAPHATQTVEVRTSAVDRARGFNIAITPLAALVGVLGVIAAWKAGAPWLSVGVLLVFAGGFTLTWLAAYAITILLTPEFISLYEAHRKWNVVAREQEERWNHYRRLNGGE